MANDTNKNLRNKIIYEIYPRAYEGNPKLKSILNDLKRIKNLGSDIIWLMPIYPIGEKNRKGSLGSPYSIKNYREIEKSLGNLEDFKELITKTHENKMLIMIDIVFNHTSRDSYLFETHQEYFYKNKNGDFGNKVDDWSDVYDLDYNNSDLIKEQIETLKFWANLGIDGIRCDVAPLVPLNFWEKARLEMKSINKNFIFLAESVEPDFIIYLRNMGITALSDSEIYRAFDITYDYDVFNYFTDYLNKKRSLNEYIEKLKSQEYIYPDNYVKLRFLENHDRDRAYNIIKDYDLLKMWTAFMYFQKGTLLLYQGQEYLDKTLPSLFDNVKINLKKTNNEYFDFLKSLSDIKKNNIFAYGNYDIQLIDAKVIVLKYTFKDEFSIGIFNVEKEKGSIQIDILDGNYKDILNGNDILILNGKIELKDYPVIIKK
ncbi:MAG: alpha-amylase family glycosyl hydrolase [Clostridiaceae bacterium]